VCVGESSLVFAAGAHATVTGGHATNQTLISVSNWTFP
jgi:hypothetical protein